MCHFFQHLKQIKVEQEGMSRLQASYYWLKKPQGSFPAENHSQEWKSSWKESEEGKKDQKDCQSWHRG